jgi:hypothetical protein
MDNIYPIIFVVGIVLGVIISLGGPWWFFIINIALLLFGSSAIVTSAVDAVRKRNPFMIGLYLGIGVLVLIAYLSQWKPKVYIILICWGGIMAIVGFIEGNRKIRFT